MLQSHLNAFLNPSSEYTPCPFWFWNDELSDAEILRQINDFHSKGVDGFVIHPRTGLPLGDGYLSDDFLARVRTAVAEAQRLGMLVLLYDEGMYPSGSAHGEVVKENSTYASRCLIMRECVAGRPLYLGERESLVALCLWGGKQYAFICCDSGGTIRGYGPNEDEGEPLAPPSADLLNPYAVACFIRHTHDRYYQAMPEFFGSTICGFFTDEPNIIGRCARPDCVPWTDDFLQDYLSGGGTVENLPLLFEDCPESEDARRLFRRAVNKRLNHVFYAQLSDWCHEHHIVLTGHPALSADIALEEHFDWPGQDLVYRMVEPASDRVLPDSVLGISAVSYARQQGRKRILNECFGCCGKDGFQWSFTADEMKWYTDWLLVRGTNLLVPHAFYYSVREGRGNERPPAIGPNNLWWKHWARFSLYMKRLCWLLTEARDTTSCAVLCEEDEISPAAFDTLWQRQIPAHAVMASAVQNGKAENGQLTVGQQTYTTLVIPSNMTIDQKTSAAIERIGHAGVTVVAEAEIAEGKADRSAAVRFLTPTPSLRALALELDGKKWLLLSNEGESCITPQLCTDAASVDVLDAWDGTLTELTPVEGILSLAIERRTSRLLCLNQTSVHQSSASTEAHQPDCRIALPSWELTLPDGRADSVIPNPDGLLPDWTTLPDMAHFSGSVTYHTAFSMDALSGNALLDLGDVRNIAEVFINGKAVPARLWAPYTFRLSGLLCKGKNELTVIVTNTLANRLDGCKLPSGLIGPVQLWFDRTDP